MSKKKFFTKKQFSKSDVSMADLDDWSYYPNQYDQYYEDWFDFFSQDDRWDYGGIDLSDESMVRKYEWPKSTAEMSLNKLIKLLDIKSAKNPLS